MIRITIDTDNAAFEDDPGYEVARILRDLSRRVESEGLPYPFALPTGRESLALLDSNGNKVGECVSE